MSGSARANIEIGATTSRLSAGLAQARAKIGAFASTAARGLQAAFSKFKLGDVGKNALGHLGGNIATRGLDALVDGAASVRDFERNLIRFQIASKGTAESTAALRNQIREVSKATGIAQDEVLAGSSQYVALTGDTQGASTAMSAFARIAQASGASVSDVAAATAALRTSMGLGAGDIEAAFSSMIIQGKEGAVEIKDMAGELAELAPQFKQFRGGTGVGGIREMGAAFQTIMTGAGSASSAATQFKSLIGEFADPETIRKLAAIKIKIFDKDPRTGIVSMRSASDIFEDLAKNQKLADPRVIAAIFGRKEAQAAVRSIRGHIDMYRDLKVAAEDTGAVQRDLNTFLESDAGRLDKAMNGLKVAIAEAFTPERITGFVNAIEGLAEHLEPVISSIGKIGEGLGKLYGVGKAVGEFLDGTQSNEVVGTIADRVRDQQIINSGGDIGMHGWQMDADAKTKAAHVMAAKARQANREGYVAARDSIMAGEVNDRTSPESIRRAFTAKYGDNAGARLVGSKYLQSAGVQDPVEVAKRTMAEVSEVAKTQKIVAAIKEGFRGVGLTADVSKDKVVKGVRSSSAHTTRVAK